MKTIPMFLRAHGKKIELGADIKYGHLDSWKGISLIEPLSTTLYL